MRLPGRQRASLVVVLAVILPGTAAAVPYLQYQVGAARTGVTTDPGPEHLDLAFTADLPGQPAFLSVPLIIGDGVFALMEGKGIDGLYRVGLTTTNVTRIVPYERAASSIASDGERLFVAGPDGIEAYPVAGGGRVWDWPFPVVLPGAEASIPRDLLRTRCAPLAVDLGSLFAACTQALAVVPPTDPGYNEHSTLINQWITATTDPGPRSFITRLTIDGGHVWTWRWEDPGVCAENVDVCEPQADPIVTSLAVSGDRVVAGGHRNGATGPRDDFGGSMHAKLVGIVAVSRGTPTLVWNYQQDPPAGIPPPAPALAIVGDQVFVLSSQIASLAASDGTVRWAQRVTPDDPSREIPVPEVNYYGAGLAVDGRRVYASGANEIVGFDVGSGRPEAMWRQPISSGGLDQMYGILQWQDKLVLADHSSDVFFLEAQSGRMIDSGGYGHQGGARYAVGEGIVAILPHGGPLAILGRAPASIHPELELSGTYPSPGEAVRIDLARTRPGALGPATAFQVDWGDGRLATWQESPRFEHAYADAGEVTGRAYARNDAGQVASVSFRLDVGGSPDVPLTVMQRAFAAENQEATFFLLGLIVTVVFALGSVARLRGHRHRLREEIVAADRIVAEEREHAERMRERLREHRLRARSLFLEGKLDEGSTGILERHVDDLLRAHRLGRVEEEFGFLPHQLFRGLQEILVDARVSGWERHQFLALLEKETTLKAEQKRIVRQRVEHWHREDAG